MASLLRRAQRRLSRLLGTVTENTATWKTMTPLCSNVVYLTMGCRARLRSHFMLWTYATAAGRDACVHATVAREYCSGEEMIRMSRGDVVPLPNM